MSQMLVDASSVGLTDSDSGGGESVVCAKNVIKLGLPSDRAPCVFEEVEKHAHMDQERFEISVVSGTGTRDSCELEEKPDHFVDLVADVRKRCCTCC